MRVSSILILAGTFASAALLSLIAARFAVTLVEETSEYSVRQSLDTKSLTWAEVYADGLQVVLTGTAPSEASRFLAISTAGTVVDAARVIDEMDVEALAALAAPRFSIEILRNEDEVSLIGLIPTGADRADLLQRLSRISNDDEIADLLDILGSHERLVSVVRGELEEIRDSYGDERRTDIVSSQLDLSDEDLINEEDLVVTISSGLRKNSAH